MNYDDYPRLIRRSPRATHELQQAFEQFQLDNDRRDYVGDEEDGCSDFDQETSSPKPRHRLNFYDEPPATSAKEPTPRSLSHVNPLQTHPVTENRTPAPSTTAPRYRFSHPFREQLYAPQQPDPAPRRHPTNLVSYKSASQRFHPRLRRQTSLDTIASVTTTASVFDSEDAQDPAPDVFSREDECLTTPNVEPGPLPATKPPRAGSLPESLPEPLSESLRAGRARSSQLTCPTTPAGSTETYPLKPTTSAETHSPKSILQKLKPGKRNDPVGADGAAKQLIIERTVSVDQRSHRSTSSSASNTPSSSTPSRYPSSEAGNSRSSSTWTASSHDISGLTPDEIKKCKKKGINPALFAEMKAARKGKWTSPIAGNTFLS